MRIVVTHLTRMQRGSVCVAGVNVETGEHVRPVPPIGALPSRVTTRHNGPFDMATVIDLGNVRPVPQPPEVEDHELTWWHARAECVIDPKLMWDILNAKSQPSLSMLFGDDLRAVGRSRAIVDSGRGIASLGVLAPRVRPWLRLDRRADGTPTVRLLVTEGTTPYNLSVTDLRLYDDDHVTPKLTLIRNLQDRLG